jgi:cytidylate kinase
MRAKKKVVVALFGRCCSGKSSIAKELAQLLNCAIHSASEAVRSKCRELGISTGELQLTEHKDIDATTYSIVALASSLLVVEGSFLDALLKDAADTYRIELVCEDWERRRRFTERHMTDGLDQRDNDDDKLRWALHGNRYGRPDVTFNTTGEKPREIAERIFEWLKTKGFQEPS